MISIIFIWASEELKSLKKLNKFYVVHFFYLYLLFSNNIFDVLDLRFALACFAFLFSILFIL